MKRNRLHRGRRELHPPRTWRRLAATALPALLLGALLLPACSTPCEELAEKICACEGSRSAVDACVRRASQIQSSRDPTEAGQARCERFIERCNCHAIGTPQGDRACGLAE